MEINSQRLLKLAEYSATGMPGLLNLTSLLNGLLDWFHYEPTKQMVAIGQWLFHVDLWTLPWIHTSLRSHSASTPHLSSALLILWDKIHLKVHLAHLHSLLTLPFGNSCFLPAGLYCPDISHLATHRCLSQLFINGHLPWLF